MADGFDLRLGDEETAKFSAAATILDVSPEP
jgi:hypothetical protein